MKLHLRVTNSDGSAVDVKVSAADLVAFESEFNRSVAKFQNEFRLTDMYWLAWHSMKRTNPSVPGFMEWLDQADPDVSFGDEDNDVVPLESNPQPSE